MNSYYNELNWSIKHFPTKIILLLSKVTSNYGQSLLRPLLTITLFNGLLFYWLYTLNATTFNGYNLSKIENYSNTIAEFIKTSNPLHKNNPELNGMPFLIDTLIRIISSYSIYNLIRATRRFVK